MEVESEKTLASGSERVVKARRYNCVCNAALSIRIQL